MDGAMGTEEEVVEAVLTCEGDFHDPELLSQIEKFKQKLTDLLLTDENKLNVRKIEPWNSVKVTVTIPREAALRLRQLAQAGNDALKEMGVLSVQLQGDSSISLTIAGRNNETTEVMLRTSGGIPGTSTSAPFSIGSSAGLSNTSSESVTSFTSMSNEEVTRKNIVDYLIQGPSRRQNTSLFDSILGASTSLGTSPLETSLGVPPPPNLFPGQMAGGPSMRQSQVPAMLLPNPAMRGSQMNSFPLSKGSGAFHIPLPNQSSVGQNPTSFYAQHMNPIMSKSTANQQGLLTKPSGSSQLKNTPGGMNTFGPVGMRLPPALAMPVNMNNALPPSSSPDIMMDLPPPPPYPHSSANNSQRPGKQVSASSPLLVNLLQTDPLSVAAGVASGNPNKPIAAGRDSASAPPPKKKRPKKSKDGVPKSALPSDPLSNSRDILGPNANVFNPIHSSESPKTMASSASGGFASLSMSKFTKESLPGGAMDPRTSVSASHVAESVLDDKRFKPLTSTDRPFSESFLEGPSSSTLSNLGTYVSSAIGTGSIKSIDSNGQKISSQETSDLFSLEIAAGKIINPYTGQLEPRDSVLESNGGRKRDHSSIHSQEGPSLPKLGPKKDVGNTSLTNVPVSVSQLKDVNVLRTCPPISSSTAAFVHSGPPIQMSSDRLPPNVSPHQRTVISDNVDGPMNIYAARLNSKKESEHNFAPVVPAIPQSINSQQQNRHIVSSSQHTSRTTTSSFTSSRESVLSQTLQGHSNLMVSQTLHSALPPRSMPIPSVASRVSSTLSGSVISSELTHSSSFPVSHESNLVQSSSNPVIFHPASCASSTAKSQSPPLHASLSNTFPSSSNNVQTQPFSSSAQSIAQIPERLKSSDSSTPVSLEHSQAANSIVTGGTTVKSAFPNLLNPLSDKPLESSSASQNVAHSPQDKISSEGDDNSNHSGLVTENVTETSGTSVLLEHSGVKAENHDSGVGSSSERSDDTPSEPGDGEFRSNSNGTEMEDASAKAAKRLVNCKVESGVDSSTSNTITVGYMMTSVDGTSQPNLLHSKDNLETVKSMSVSLPPMILDSKSDRLGDSHVHSTEKSLDRLSSNHTMSSSMNWVVEMNKNQPPAQEKRKLNGPLQEDKESINNSKIVNPEIKLNGPGSESEFGKMFIAMDDLQDFQNAQLKFSSAVKGNGPDHDKLKEEEIREIVRLNRESALAEDEMGKTHLSEKGDDSPDHLAHSMTGSDDRLEHLNYFDMEDLVNGKLLGNGTMGADGKPGGGNITSIYSKRSSPVNVNMLNHIYAPGLPLPRRLTESVQRLVKPLPASETSVPQMRLCKSPGMGSTRASGVNGSSPSRMSFHSGTRSPGASMPKLIPNDKHSLLSGGLDLAGLSSVSYQHTLQAPDVHLGNSSFPITPNADSQLLSSSTGHLPSVSVDSMAHAHKILSQSYPPHKSRDLSNNLALYDLFSHIQPLCSPSENFSSSPATTSNSNVDLNVIQTSKTNCDSSVSPPFPTSQAWKSAHRQLTPKEGALMNHTPDTSSSSSNSNSLALPTSEKQQRSEENTIHSINFPFEAVSSSSPEHSNTALPNASVVQSKDFTDHVTKSSIQSSPCLSTANSLSPVWTTVSLTNGGGSSISSTGTHPTASSASRHVPYLTHGATLATSSLGSSSSSGKLIPNMAPSPSSKALLATSVSAHATAKLDMTSPQRLPLKPETSSSPRAGTASAAPLRRNLFESVSGELSSVCPAVSSHASLSRTLDTAPIPQQPNSVLDGPRSSKSPSESSFSPSGDQESLDFISLQSIRTNETPSTSLPAQVVHLDFPHYSSPSTTLCSTSYQQPSPPKPPPSSNNVPVCQPHHHPSPTGSGKTSPDTNSTTSFLTLPTKSTTLASVPETCTVDSIVKTIASVASGQSEAMVRCSKEGSCQPSLPVKEPILEVLASSLDPSLKATVESLTHSKISVMKASSDAAESVNLNPLVPQESSTDLSVSLEAGSGALPKYLESTHETLAQKGRKRSLPCDETVNEDADGDSFSPQSPPAKRHHPDLKPAVTMVTISSDPSVNVAEPIVQANVVKADLSKGKDDSSTDDKDDNVSRGVERTVKVDTNTVLPEGKFPSQAPASPGFSEGEESHQGLLKNLSDDSFLKVEKESVSPPTHESDSLTLPSSNVQTEQNSIQGETKSVNVAQEVKTGADDGNETMPNQLSAPDSEINGNQMDAAKVGDGSLSENAKPSKTSEMTDQLQKEVGLKDGGNNTSSVLIVDAKHDDTARRGRVKRQFYAYVPEKSIDQTYFDTPILSGRTRSRNKPAEPAHGEGAPPQDGVPVSSGDVQTVNSGSGAGKVEASQDNSASKRSTRSLRTKETAQDPSAAKRRRVQSREHR